MTSHILKYSLILLAGFLLHWWIFNFSSLSIPENIPATPIKVYGLSKLAWIITILIFFQKGLLKAKPERGILTLTLLGTYVYFIADVIFKVFMISIVMSAETTGEDIYFYLYNSIVMILFATILSFFVAFQLKTKRTLLLSVLIVAF
ncbi:hypothetical protein EG028_20475 [Chitinophaga barathri]|uniref:Uncharacterized protein n=1 Tax=Chitinophaga barathri TaxID=1647451 RepID=A0A3N4MCA1_9BACT|nr:hypothetical protein EG028_20475 [Chitinophaga barathri]